MDGVYFIRDKGNRAIKVGYTGNLENRIVNLQTGNPQPLVLVAFWDSATMLHERMLHDVLNRARVQGEWFEEGAVFDWLDANAGALGMMKVDVDRSKPKDPMEKKIAVYKDEYRAWYYVTGAVAVTMISVGFELGRIVFGG